MVRALMSPTSDRASDHAIVIGAGMSGLLAARVLRDHFQRVTILDRDHLPDGVEPRAGAPQGHHVHVLITRGWQILDALFPGLAADLDAAGAAALDWIDDVAFHTPFGLAPRFASPLRSRASTRPLLERHVRARTLADPRVRLLDGLDVTGLRAEGDPARVVGVHVQRRGAGGPPPGDDELRADLVVDASGRGSKLAAWLDALGQPAPAETVVDGKLGYATRIYSRAPGAPWKALYVMGRAPDQPRSGVIYPIEGDRWIVTLVGYGGQHPPTDEAGFLAHARALAVPDLADALAAAAPLSTIHGYRRTENRVRHYEALRRRPLGLLVLGDAACTLNPVYGQGMTAAALAADTLDRLLRERPAARDLAPRFQRRLAAAVRPALDTATGDDFRWPHTEGKRPAGQRLVHGLVDRIFAAATRDPAIHLRLMQVLHLLRPTAALFHPYVLRRALLG